MLGVLLPTIRQEDDALDNQGVIICRSSRDSAKNAIDRTIRVASGDVDWAIKILGYLGIRTYGALVGMRIEVLSAGFNNVDVD